MLEVASELLLLLLFVYAAANVVVFGAEFASEWSRYDAGLDPGASG